MQQSLSNITLNESQENALKKMKAFVESTTDRCFILTGYAGTGKTTLMRFLIDFLDKKRNIYYLLSTTGRAAKILSNYTACEAHTIHHLIYTYIGLNKDFSELDSDKLLVEETGQILINFAPSTYDGKKPPAIYIVDEASMISNTRSNFTNQAQFGSGKLLTELLNYDNRKKSKFIFVGDPCQLPPIEGSISPALSKLYIERHFKIPTQTASLTQIVRQDNSIIQAAEVVRKFWFNAPLDNSSYGKNNVWGILPIKKYSDIYLYPNLQAMLSEYIDIIRTKGYNEAAFICQSNQQCSQLSLEIRQRMGFKGTVQPKDLLLVQQNQFTTGLMNGDMVEVVAVNPIPVRTIKTKGKDGYTGSLSFLEISVKELATNKKYTTLLIENIVSSGKSNLDEFQQTSLFIDFVIRMRKFTIEVQFL